MFFAEHFAGAKIDFCASKMFSKKCNAMVTVRCKNAFLHTNTFLRTFYVQKYIFARKMFNKAIAKGYFLFTVFLLVYKANLELARKWISKKKS